MTSYFYVIARRAGAYVYSYTAVETTNITAEIPTVLLNDKDRKYSL